ncbi:LuxR family transcriptional regulator [Asanoa sp. NPDC049518]|uniref:helix-turn-helix transcriptional regulator n=1 Tax=unclassified Asanoa TaxID=2685164 RepID=UPI00342D0DCF
MSAGHGLLGRRGECELFDQLVTDVRAGKHRLLVLRGEPGVGKTALLDYVAGKALDAAVIRVTGVESEMELTYAGLYQVCGRMLGQLDVLPTPQRDALRVAFGLVDGPAPDHLLVGLAALTLLSEWANRRPLVCLIDDVQWLDEASTKALAFVARRLGAEPIAMVFAELEPDRDQALAGLPELVVTGLDDRDARRLLASAAPGLRDERVRDRILAEARGNPLALLELPVELASSDLAWVGQPTAESSESRSARIERAYLRRVRGLPRQARQFLLLAAVEPLGDAGVVWRAASASGLDEDVGAIAQAAGLIKIGLRISFVHPLARSAVRRSAQPFDLRRAHAALAEATDRRTDPDRRTWHLAAAAVAPDDRLAEELAHCADRAAARGGAASNAAYLRRAAELTAQPIRRAQRAVAAGEAALAAGALDAADELVTDAEMVELDGLHLARLEHLRAQLMFARGRADEAPALLIEAARHFAPLDGALARETYLEALMATEFAGAAGLRGHQGMRWVAEAARSAPANQRPQDAVDLLLDGLSTLFTQGHATAAPTLRRAVDAGRTADAGLISLTSSLVAMELWDATMWQEVLRRHVDGARASGTLSLLPKALDYYASFHVQTGEFATAIALAEEAAALDATIRVSAPYTRIVLAAWHGDPAGTGELSQAAIRDTSADEDHGVLRLTQYAAALLNNGLGRYTSALGAATRVADGTGLAFASWALAEVVEAAARLEQWEVAQAALRQLSERTKASGTPWALGTEARSRALLSRGPDADDLYRTAIDRLAESGMNAHLARAQLVYGEWLRRNNRRADARRQLQPAHDLFMRIRAKGFGERARNELLATGGTTRKRTPDTTLDLTPQESLIASRARDGQTNQEIGAELFISPRTVEWHLGKVFAKLAIDSRRELRDTPLPLVVQNASG